MRGAKRRASHDETAATAGFIRSARGANGRRRTTSPPALALGRTDRNVRGGEDGPSPSWAGGPPSITGGTRPRTTTSSADGTGGRPSTPTLMLAGSGNWKKGRKKGLVLLSRRAYGIVAWIEPENVPEPRITRTSPDRLVVLGVVRMNCSWYVTEV